MSGYLNNEELQFVDQCFADVAVGERLCDVVERHLPPVGADDHVLVGGSLPVAQDRHNEITVVGKVLVGQSPTEYKVVTGKQG